MDNKGYNSDIPVSNHSKSEIKQNLRNEVEEKSSKFSGVKRSYSRSKSQLQNNKYTHDWFPPSGLVSTCLTLLMTIFIVFGAARVVLGDIADVGGTIFALLMLILIALIGGRLIDFISFLIRKFLHIDIHLPPLLGMLIVGIVLKNVPYNFGQFGRAECTKDHKNATFVDSIHELDNKEDLESWRRKRSISEDDFKSLKDNEDVVLARIVRSAGGHDAHDAHETKKDSNSSDEYECKERYIGHDLDPYISRTLRQICLTVILLMAGLELDPVALSRLSGMVVRATFIPCLVEATAVAVLSNLILGLPWTVGFMLGFILAAVSPAVIIPALMSLSGRGYGVAKGIPTLVIAACAADDVVAISGFGIFLGVTFSLGSPLWKLILHGPIEVVIGVSFGVFWGIICQWIPHKDHRHVAFFRWLILFGGGLIALFGAHLIHYDGAGGLASIIMAFVAGMQWRREGWGDHNPVTKTFQRMWIILQPIIFALIGTEIQVDKIDGAVLGKSIGVLFLALIIRMCGTYVAVMGGELNIKEKIFMAIAWLPKATVQAALGPLFLAKVSEFELEKFEQLCDPEEYSLLECQALWIKRGNDILTLAVLSILITAPLGALAILGTGPRLLEQDKTDKKNEDIDDVLDGIEKTMEDDGRAFQHNGHS